MPRPTTKEALITQSQTEFEALITLIDHLPKEIRHQNFATEDRDKNIRDILYHLYGWHQLLSSWYDRGVIHLEMFNTPGEGYTWRTLPSLNQVLWQQAQNHSLEETLALLNDSHQSMMNILQERTENELFEKGHYPFTKSSTLGAYFIGSLSSHYHWAIQKIKKLLKK